MDNKQKLEAIIKREEISARQYSDKISEWSQAFLNCLKSANLDSIQVDGDAVWLYIGDIDAEFCRLKRRPTKQPKQYNFIDLNSYNRPCLSLKSLTKKTLNSLWFHGIVVDLQHQLTIKQAKKMKVIKTALQRLLDNGFTPNQIANQLRLLDTTPYNICPLCDSGDIRVVENCFDGDSDLVSCNDCQHEWHEMRFSFGIENVG